jgi:hypothetical protein
MPAVMKASRHASKTVFSRKGMAGGSIAVSFMVE